MPRVKLVDFLLHNDGISGCRLVTYRLSESECGERLNGEDLLPVAGDPVQAVREFVS